MGSQATAPVNTGSGHAFQRPWKPAHASLAELGLRPCGHRSSISPALIACTMELGEQIVRIVPCQLIHIQTVAPAKGDGTHIDIARVRYKANVVIEGEWYRRVYLAGGVFRQGREFGALPVESAWP
ncbi:hypothetical protein CIHG_01075 [Coccidioides immitis H538.4]|uniref:Uncharacterized protein n=1 Tax=Coccidioides immitis H538.4 TaxID=396776 RepID=A0A0J8U8B8_COCIT|nr:hypothetical protein CIHG_01075 [Coccidioides immitis H538.4]